ncbi:hypothetical protein D0T51_06715 [Parabacteroides sp. 52]|nr:hypothetical protein [Parabacteroides sp. 52]
MALGEIHFVEKCAFQGEMLLPMRIGNIVEAHRQHCRRASATLSMPISSKIKEELKRQRSQVVRVVKVVK